NEGFDGGPAMNTPCTDDRSGWAIVPKTALLAAVVAFCCWWSISYTRGPAGVSTLWAASGVLCGVLLTSPRASWRAYIGGAFLASLCVNLWLGTSPFLAVALSLANMLDAGLVSVLVARYVANVTEQARIKRTAEIALAATLVACTVSALLA